MSLLMPCYDLTFLVCEFLPLATLLRLSQTSHSHRRAVMGFVRSLLQRRIRRYIPHPDDLLELMFLHGAVIGQDVALEVALHGLATRSMQHITLAIYVPCNSEREIGRLFVREGYVSVVEWLRAGQWKPETTGVSTCSFNPSRL